MLCHSLDYRVAGNLIVENHRCPTAVVTDEFIKSGAAEIPKMYEATIDIEKKIDVNQRCYEVCNSRLNGMPFPIETECCFLV